MTGRVLLVLTSAQRRGAEIEGFNLGRRLRSAGFEVQTVALAAGSGQAALDVEVLGPSARSPSGWRKLRRLARANDVVVAYGSATLPAVALSTLGSRVPFVYRSIGDPRRWAGGRARRLRTGWLLRRATKVVALWASAGDDLVRLYRVQRSRVVIVPNSRDPQTFRPATAQDRADARRALGVPQSITMVALVGALSAEKRPMLAVDAVAQIPGAWLTIAGTGPLVAPVTSRAVAVLPGRHLILGSVDDVRPVLAAADVLVLPSATEGMPGVLIEAAMVGRRVVATDVGACKDMMTAGVSGAIVPVDVDPSELKSALGEMVAMGDPQPSKNWSETTAVAMWTELLGRFAQGEVEERL